jgi:hypothetical protein
MRRADARSRETDRPDGIAFTFQVIVNNVEPAVGNRCFNLFTKEDERLALRDEAKPRRPKMTGIGTPMPATGTTERLTRTTAGPDGAVVGPAGESERGAPAADAGEKVALGKSVEIGGSNIDD